MFCSLLDFVVMLLGVRVQDCLWFYVVWCVGFGLIMVVVRWFGLFRSLFSVVLF